MYPCSRRIRATSTRSFDDGIVTSWCWALAALRSRVRKSAIGSVIDMVRASSPARLRHAGDVSVVRQFAQADSADAELAIDGARPATPAAAGVAARLVLRRAALTDNLGSLG